MADRTIVLAQNKRHAVRGLTVVNPQEFSAYQEDDDDLTYVVDMSSYLDGATISSVTRTPNGVTVSNTSNTTTRLTQRLKGFGYVDINVTSSSGEVEQFRITVKPRANSAFFLSNTGSVPQNTAQLWDTVADVTAANIDSGISWIRTQGYYSVGDGGGALYKRVYSAPSHGAYITSNAASSYWELAEAIVSARMLGARGDGVTEDHVAIQAAIDFCNSQNGGPVLFPPGTYLIGATITLKSKVVLVGENYATTTIKAKASLNADMLKTLNYSALTGTNSYLISAGLQYGFGLQSLTIDGNKSSQSSGNGLVCYGKKYFLENVVIYNVKEIGWISEGWFTVGTSEFPDEPESIYRNVDVQYCGSHGIRYRGPTDAYWSAVFSHENTGWGIRFETDASTYNAASDVIHVHVYTNTAGGIYNSAKMRFGHVATESNYGQGLVDTSFASSYGYIESYINCRTTGTHQIELSGSAIEVGRIWNADGSENVSGVLTSGNFNRINSGVLNGDGSTGIGLTLAGAQCHANCTVYGYSGASGVGIQFGHSATPLTTSSFDLQIYNCKTGYNNAVAGNRNDGRLGVSLTSGQSLVSTDFAANENVYVGTTDAAAASVSQQTVPQGALAAPGIAFSGDRDTGVYRPSANRVSLVAGGVEGLSASASGSTPQVGFMGTAPTSKATITGSRGGNAALASLLTELAAKGLITDSSTA